MAAGRRPSSLLSPPLGRRRRRRACPADRLPKAVSDPRLEQQSLSQGSGISHFLHRKRQSSTDRLGVKTPPEARDLVITRAKCLSLTSVWRHIVQPPVLPAPVSPSCRGCRARGGAPGRRGCALLCPRRDGREWPTVGRPLTRRARRVPPRPSGASWENARTRLTHGCHPRRRGGGPARPRRSRLPGRAQVACGRRTAACRARRRRERRRRRTRERQRSCAHGPPASPCARRRHPCSERHRPTGSNSTSGASTARSRGHGRRRRRARRMGAGICCISWRHRSATWRAKPRQSCTTSTAGMRIRRPRRHE